MNFRTCMLAVAGLFVLTSTASAEPYRDSWGKLDVSFSQYRQDASDCALLGMIRSLEAARDQGIDGAGGSGGMLTPAGFYASVDPGLLSILAQNDLSNRHAYWQNARAAVDSCLMTRGYTRFRLDRDQLAHLGTLAPGSEERHRYLYSLATDPYTLEVQQHPLY